MIRRLAAVAFALTSSFALPACGDDGGEADDLTPEQQQEVADQVIAAFEARVADDGFASTGEPDEDENDDLVFDSEECREFEEAFGDELPNQTANADSDEFERGEVQVDTGVQETVEASAGFSGEESDIDRVFDLLRDDRVGACLDEAFRKGIEEAGAAEQGLEVADLEVEELTSDDLGDPGDDATGFRLSGTFSVAGFEFAFEFEARFVRVGRSAVALMTSSFGPDEPQVDADALVAVLVDAMETATSG